MEPCSRDLPDHVMKAIFLRLPKQSLERFAGVSEPWRRLLSDPTLYPQMLGFYTRGLFYTAYDFIPTPSPVALHRPADHEAMGMAAVELSLRTKPELNEIIEDFSRLYMVNVTAAGFMFFNIMATPTNSTVHDKSTFFLYNPALEQRILIPRLPTPLDVDEHVGLIFHDPCTNPPRFAMVRVRMMTGMVDVFDTSFGRWEERREVGCPSPSDVLHHRERRDNVYPFVTGGVAAHGIGLYWFFSDTHVLCYDHRRSHLWLVPLPEARDYCTGSQLVESEGQLFFVALDEKGFRMWVLREDRSSWELERDLSLPELFSRSPETLSYVGRHCRETTHLHIHPLALDPSDRRILFLWWGTHETNNCVVLSVHLGNREAAAVSSDAAYALCEMYPVMKLYR